MSLPPESELFTHPWFPGDPGDTRAGYLAEMEAEAVNFDKMLHLHGVNVTFNTTPAITQPIIMEMPGQNPASREIVTPAIEEPVRSADMFYASRTLEGKLNRLGGNTFTYEGRKYSISRVAPETYSGITLFILLICDIEDNR